MFPVTLYPRSLYPIQLYPKVGGSGPPPPPSSGYLGRFQQGQIVKLQVATLNSSGFPVAPDEAPVVTVTDPNTNAVLAVKMAMNGGNLNFYRDLFLDFSFTMLGRFNIGYSWNVGGVNVTSTGAFDLVSGGDGAGTIISLISYTRPDAVYICAQTSSGRLMQGKNPLLY